MAGSAGQLAAPPVATPPVATPPIPPISVSPAKRGKCQRLQGYTSTFGRYIHVRCNLLVHDPVQSMYGVSAGHLTDPTTKGLSSNPVRSVLLSLSPAPTVGLCSHPTVPLMQSGVHPCPLAPQSGKAAKSDGALTLAGVG